MSTNKVKLMKKFDAIKQGYRRKIKFLQSKVTKLKVEKDVLLEQIHESTESTKKIKEELRAVNNNIDNLKKYVECPICLEAPRKAPIFTCPNGHFLCHKCKRGRCPTCREKMGDNTSILAVAVTEIIYHDCKFVECEDKFPLEQIEKHEKLCTHRIVSCPYLHCDEKTPLSKLLDHLLKSCSNGNEVTVIRSSGQQNFSADMRIAEGSWKVEAFEHQGNNYVLCAQRSGDNYHFTVVMLESPDICSNVYIELEVYKASSLPDKRLSAKLSCNPCSIDHTESEMKEQGLTVHCRVMEKMALREESFIFTVKFTII